MLPSAPSEARLGSIWSGAVEVMLCPGGDVYLVPSTSCPSPSGGALPPLLREHVVFALTAFDPPGESLTLPENAAANGRLWKRILALHPAPSAVWPAWGYNLAEGWREDGFCLAYPIEEVARTPSLREAVVNLAKEFRQGAIFQYYPDAGEGEGSIASSMSRTTVPALSSDAVHETVRVWRVAGRTVTDAAGVEIGGHSTGGGAEGRGEGPAHMLLRPWAGPTDALTHQWTRGRD